MGSEATTPIKLGQIKDGNQMPHQSIYTIDFLSLAAIIFHFLKNTCLRTMECLHCELKVFFRLCIYICIKQSKG